MTQQPVQSTGQPRQGEQWSNADMVRDFVDRTDKVEAMRDEVFAFMASVAPFEREAPLRILDLGSGHGVLAAAMLEAFPNAQAIGLDLSDAMMEVGKERMARFGNRFRYQEGDFSPGALPPEVAGPFDLVVSSLAIHHATPEGKQRLYADLYKHLDDGGCVLILDNMRMRNDRVLQQNHDRVRHLLGDPRGERPSRMRQDLPAEARPPRPASEESGSRMGGGTREYVDPLEDHLQWLRAAGFPHVDCFWKRLDYAMVGGFKDKPEA
jgi:tRNA (cmo5U34)-methyltransferase